METSDDRRAPYASSPQPLAHWAYAPLPTNYAPPPHHATSAREYSAFEFGLSSLVPGPAPQPHPPPPPPPSFDHPGDVVMQNPQAQPPSHTHPHHLSQQQPQHDHHPDHRAPPPQLHPLVMPLPWPSLLQQQPPSVSTAFPPPYVSQLPYAPASAPPAPGPGSGHQLHTPVSATSARSSGPRRTLTDNDRRRMCRYAEENPHSKQTEIGAVFGVERSTVSKVLRHRDKYMTPDDGGQSPVKRGKGRSPDIERALANWARKEERKGAPLDDGMIREKARAFAATTTQPDHHYNYTLSPHWLGKFKLKNNLLGARSGKGPHAPEDPDAVSPSQTPYDVSPISPPDVVSPELQRPGARGRDSPAAADRPRSVPFHHSHSTTSLRSAFTDPNRSPFSSPGPLSPTPPYFTDAAPPAVPPHPSSFPPSMPSALPVPTSCSVADQDPSRAYSHHHHPLSRPRSHTLPFHADHYMTPSSSIAAPDDDDAPTPRYPTTAPLVLDPPPMTDHRFNTLPVPGEPVPSSLPPTSHPTPSIGGSAHLTAVSPSATMRPPPLPTHLTSSTSSRRGSHDETPYQHHQHSQFSTPPSTLATPPSSTAPCAALSTAPPSTASLSTAPLAPTPEDARHALEVLRLFVERQPGDEWEGDGDAARETRERMRTEMGAWMGKLREVVGWEEGSCAMDGRG